MVLGAVVLFHQHCLLKFYLSQLHFPFLEDPFDLPLDAVVEQLVGLRVEESGRGLGCRVVVPVFKIIEHRMF